jgi:uncharacterized Fe-S cluster protein YjdI
MDQQPRKRIIFNPRRKDITKKYTNGEVTVVWKPKLCIHSTLCYTGLPEVFDPDQRPWVIPGASTTEKIVAQVKECPSNALSYYMNGENESTEDRTEEIPSAPAPEVTFEALPNGPLLVRGYITIKDNDGNELQKGPVTAFCRCGATKNKPYCDGAHSRVGFKG